jgi:hypothetical protein
MGDHAAVVDPQLTIVGLTLSESDTAIYVDDFPDAKIDPTVAVIDSRITRNATAGIGVTGEDFSSLYGSGLEEKARIVLANSSISDNPGNGVSVGLYVGRDVELLAFDTTISQNGGHGLQFDGTSGYGFGTSGSIENCSITGNLGAGIKGTRLDLNIDSSTIAGNLQEGIRLGGASDKIRNELRLSDTRITDNGGDGIYADPVFLQMDASTISGNGGSGVKWSYRSATVRSSTISGNGNGGLNFFSTWASKEVEVVNSTISDNRGGYGVFAWYGAVVLQNSTVTRNTQGGVAIEFGSAYALNSIIARNSGLDLVELGDDVSFSSAFSLIAVPGTASVHEVVQGSNIFGRDPRLGPLADNGGPTETHALLADSPAINAADPNFSSPPDFDQRGAGFPRVGDGRLDMGAFEAQPRKQTGLLQVVGDVNGNGSEDVAVVASSGIGVLQATVYDSRTGGRISRFALRDITDAVATTGVPNFKGSSAPELAVLDKSGTVEVRDTRRGSLLSRIAFHPALQSIDLGVLTSGTVPALAVLGSKSGTGIVETRSAATGAILRRVSYHADLRPRDLVTTETPKRSLLGMLGEHVDALGRDRVQLGSSTGAWFRNLSLGSGYAVHQSIGIGDVDGNGVGEIATLRTKRGDVNVIVHDPITGKQISRLGFASGFEPIAISGVADLNRNNAAEVALLARDRTNGKQRVEVRDGRSGALLTRSWLPSNFLGEALAKVVDINGNGAEELVILGRRDSDGALNVFIRDALTGENLKRIRL